MPDTDRELLVLRQSARVRVFAGAFFAVWAAILVSFLFAEDFRQAGTLWRAVPVLMLGYGAVMAVRWQRMAVLARPEELVVRNPWRTYTVPRAQVTGFSTGRYQRIGHRTGYADLRDGGQVRLVALDQPFPLPGRERSIEPALDRLEAWRAGSR